IAEVCAGIPQVLVADPRAALTRLANRVLARSCIETVIGVTGSAGKTTTRELLATVLNAGYPGAVLRPAASYNTDTGLSMTILNGLIADHRYAVLEMGAQRVGEIAALCRLAPPQIGVVTNVGGAHLEFFGSLEGVATAKGELIEALPVGGLAVLNGDDPRVRAMVFRSRAPAVLYGLGGHTDYTGSIADLTPAGMLVHWRGPAGNGEARLQAIGRHNLLNVLAVVAVAERCGLPSDTIQRGLEQFAPVHSRLQLRSGPAGSVVIDDSYNANRVSMLAALATLQELGQPGKRIAVLGDMYELGPFAEDEHRAVGAAAASASDRLIAFGSLARWIAAGARDAGMAANRIEVISAPGDAAFRIAPPPPDVGASRRSLATQLAAELTAGDVLLIKAARGMRLDYLVELLLSDQNAG
ncbi:MAG TPA: UDP-N-acetylmuramoyl-tripeptide--D-alanyl-D-alanine ligase, partial [Chloroflexota bacterium]|nr:UDP-N-acetylmuramoyl-tripeptide--D-alanyl-D-alanine ligase [Chloroflexota bacterium]